MTRNIGVTAKSLYSKYFRRSYQKLYLSSYQKLRRINLKSRKVIGGVLLAAVTVSGSIYYFSTYTSAAYIVLDGQKIGMVSSIDVGRSLVQSVLEEPGQAVGQIAKTNRQIDYQRVWVKNNALQTDSISEDELRDKLSPYVEGYAIKVAGEIIADLPSEKDADKVLADLKNYYAQPSEAKKVTSVEFQNNVTIEKIDTQPDQILSSDQVLDMLKKGKESVKEYIVQDDDSWWLIARKNDMLTKEVLDSNPDLSEDTVLKPGLKIKLVSVTPYIDVVSKGESSVTETIPFDVITKTDYSLASGKTQITQQGSNGSKVVTYSFVQKNEKIIEKSVLDEKTSKEPIDKVIVQGPKVIAQAPQVASSYSSRGSGQASKLIDLAFSLRGIPYKWGGTTRNGFDCSGFVQYVFKGVGISLPRTSFEQYKVGVPVSRDKLQPGDLVFFSTYSKGASDVRIYIGDGQTIGAGSDGIAVHSLSEIYWNKRYLGARRI